MAVGIKDFFERADKLPFTDLSALVGAGGVLVVAPHPDDESLGCGGLMALCRRADRAVHVVVVTDGTGSHPASRRYPHDVLRDLRELEMLTACGQLGLQPTDVTFLRLPDRAVPSSGEAASEAVSSIAGQARAIDASLILVTWKNDPHCDHQASFVLAQAAARHAGLRLLQYPVWGHTRDDGLRLEPPHGYRLDIADVLDRKIAAVAAHRSQTTYLIDDDPDGFILSPDMIARFQRPFEIYLEA